jgi:hypothetical protein
LPSVLPLLLLLLLTPHCLSFHLRLLLLLCAAC